ncbi:glycoside hydrolase family 13 protein [Lichenicola cladoniae]|uniref:Glycoside hydrolase family 13 protein n=1 Tax=Lichenicola cladoniae TaxID=1484109 RepID=A0A6M8HRY7_9PROT|nr:glycoside hydrolase family 13 protein [Lichenicola cladoniae]NPD65708.1 glycoside hydrolase family 13 protein [Acetobacteraceae bacterium]QKE91269.1 glycoside hydrolase family 13 protein [Lichenicola cladoniae]
MNDQIATTDTTATEWWRTAVIYQVYPRSFADSDGDGIGDLPGITSRLPYLARLGVDAVWLSPFYPSPQADAGYDVSDYRGVDPLFGTLEDCDRLLRDAHALGLRVIVDLVPNHTSDEHAWFRAAVASPPGSPERARYIFRDGQGPDGTLPPNNWKSVFGGRAWSRWPGESQWYLHLFDRRQPDLDWQHPEVRTEFEDVLRFWLDRGVDGFRVDVAHGLIKAPGLPDWERQASMVGDGTDDGVNMGPMWDQDGVHAIYRDWRRVLDAYPGDRMMVAEAWVRPQAHLARYVRPDEMHQAFNFDYLLARWDARMLRRVIDGSLAAAASVGAPTTWVMSNHDTVRHTARLGLSKPGVRPKGIDSKAEQPDEALGLRRARALAFLTLALPGSAYLYQGEELGLPEHTTLDAAYRQDPAFHRTNGAEVGRDGCRVPIPWIADAPSFGFGPGPATWLPQPDGFAHYAVDQQEDAPGSTLELYRAVLRLRREYGLGNGQLRWLDSGPDMLVLDNGPVRVVVNFGFGAAVLPAGRLLIGSVSSEQPEPEIIQGNSAMWLAVPGR